MEPDPKYEQKYYETLKAIILGKLQTKNCSVFLFGSRATGNFKWGSDFDIGISGLSEDEFLRLKYEILDRIEESIVPWKVDIINFDTADNKFKKKALQDYEVWKSA